MKSIYIITLACATSLLAQPQSSHLAVQLSNTDLHIFSSKAVNDTFHIQVALPPAYSKASDSFPVVYLLDADKFFGLARDVTESLTWNQEAPQVIVVGISYGGSTKQWFEKRGRDYLPTKDTLIAFGRKWPMGGGSDALMAFMRTELFPFIDQNYRTLPDDRTIVGLCGGGLFATYALVTDPSLFNRYIIVAPYLFWDNKRIFASEQELFSRQSTLRARVFTAVGSRDIKNITQPWQQFNSIIASRKYKDLIWIERMYPDETHVSVFPGALAKGLIAVFSK